MSTTPPGGDCVHCGPGALPNYEKMVTNLPRTQAAGDFVTWLRDNGFGLPADDDELQYQLLRWIDVDVSEYFKEHYFLATMYSAGEASDETPH